MSEPFIGEIRMTAISYAPKDWALCDGQSMAIAQNPALFALLGTEYGGDGRTTFNLPDFRGRTPVGEGEYRTSYEAYQYDRGNKGGQNTVTLSLKNLPTHTHTFEAVNQPAELNPPVKSPLLADSAAQSELYGPPPPNSDLTELHEATSTFTGGGQSHNNMQPTTVVNFIISLTGLFPSRN